MGERNSERDITPREAPQTRPAAYFRGWFLVLLVSAWVLGGAGVLIWGARAGVALALVAALLLAVDARGLFTLQGRLAWSHTGAGGRAFLALLLVALLPLVISFYLLVAIVRYRRGIRLRAASHPLVDQPLATSHSGDGAATLATAASARSTFSTSRPVARTTPQATSHPIGRAPSAPIVVSVTRPLASSPPPPRPTSAAPRAETDGAAPATTPEEAEEAAAALATSRLAVTSAPSALAEERATRRGRGRAALLVGCLAAGVGILLLSCGMLAFAGPLRLFGGSGAHSTARPPAVLGGQGMGNAHVSATASATPAMPAPTHTATSPATPTPTAQPTATATPTSRATPTPQPAVTPRPRATIVPKPRPKPRPRPRPTPIAPPAWQPPSSWQQPPQWQNPPSWPPPAPIFNPTPWQSGYGPSAVVAGSAAPLRVTFSCALDGPDAAQSICFNAPPGQRIEVEVAFRCADPYVARERISRSLAAARDGALEWTWAPKRACQVGRAHIRLRTRYGDQTVEMRATVATGNWP